MLEEKGREVIRRFLLEKEEFERKENKKLVFDLSLKIGKEITIQRFF